MSSTPVMRPTITARMCWARLMASPPSDGLGAGRQAAACQWTWPASPAACRATSWRRWRVQIPAQDQVGVGPGLAGRPCTAASRRRGRAEGWPAGQRVLRGRRSRRRRSRPSGAVLVADRAAAGGRRGARSGPGCGRWSAASRRWDRTRSRCRPAGAGPAPGGRGSGRVGVHPRDLLPVVREAGTGELRPGLTAARGLERRVVVELALALAAVGGALGLGDGPAQARGRPRRPRPRPPSACRPRGSPSTGT